MADQDTMREFPLLVRIKTQTGGLNTHTYPTEIRDDQGQEYKNLFADPGLLKKRGGTDTFATCASGVSGAIRSLVDFRPDDGSGHSLLYQIGSEIYSSNTVGTVSLRATLPTSDYEGEFEQGFNKVFFCDGQSDPLVFNTALSFSTIASGVTAMPRHTTSEYFLNRIWTNDINNKAHVAYSGVLDDIFDLTAQVFKFGEGAGNSEVLKILGYRNQELLIFMNNRIEEIIITNPGDESTWVRRVIDDRYGIGAKDTVKEIGGVIYFLDNERRVRALNRTALDAPTGTQAIAISEQIETDLDRINILHIDKCSAGVYGDFYMLSMPLDDATENDNIYIYDVTQQAWYGPWVLPAAKFVETDIRSRGQDAMFGNTTNGNIVRMFDGTFDDDGSAYEVSLTTKKYDMGRPESDKIFNEVEFAVLGTGEGTVTVQARVDEAGFTDVGTFTIVSGGPLLPENLPFNLGGTGIVRGKFHLEGFSRGRNIDFKLTHNETFDIQILEWILTVQDQNYERENING